MDYVVIQSRDYEISPDEALATADVIDAAIAGRALSFVDWPGLVVIGR